MLLEQLLAIRQTWSQVYRAVKLLLSTSPTHSASPRYGNSTHLLTPLSSSSGSPARTSPTGQTRQLSMNYAVPLVDPYLSYTLVATSRIFNLLQPEVGVHFVIISHQEG